MADRQWRDPQFTRTHTPEEAKIIERLFPASKLEGFGTIWRPRQPELHNPNLEAPDATGGSSEQE